jgi:septum formation protein
MEHRLVLASASVTRLRVLRAAGFDPAVVVSGVGEEIDGLDTAQAVVVLAERKGLAVVGRCPDSLVLSCDSMLDLDGQSLGKPATAAQAEAVWRQLSGHRGTLHTGHCLIDTRTGRRLVRRASTEVHFGMPTAAEVKAYVASGEPLAMAGAFSLDGRGGPFVEGIEGDPGNVLGLSLPLFRHMLAEFGISITSLWTEGEAETETVAEERGPAGRG